MCGRFTLTVDADTLAAQLELEDVPSFEPRYNLAPTQNAPVVGVNPEKGVRTATMMRWGLVPFWADDPKIGNRMINARSETAHEKPAFRAAFKRRRCLIPADGFYEWKKTGDGKQPYRVVVGEGELFAMAGLWESWSGSDDGDEEVSRDRPLHSFTILTTTPNDRIAELHDRMPVILAADEYDRWLDPTFEDVEALREMLDAFPAQRTGAYPVSRYVNSPSNDDPQCIEPVDA